jgi:hypothetical protein
VDEHRNNGFNISLYSYTVFISNSIGEAEYPHLNQIELYDQVLSKYLNKEEWDEIRPRLLPIKINTPSRDNLRKMLDEHFVIEEVKESTGMGYWDMSALYVFRKKAQ